MIQRIPFGGTGHRSSRVIFGAAALAGMRQERADDLLETLLEYGINHIDTAARYGDSELRIAPWLREYREEFFVATKVGDGEGRAVLESIERSLERLGIEQLDLIQLHNLTDEIGWHMAMGRGGAVEACIEARRRGYVRFIGVTGHGTLAPSLHLRSLEHFDFDSVLVPYSYLLMQSEEYAEDFEQLVKVCREREVAIQTIKTVARRRWREDAPARRYSWYEPLRDEAAIRRAVHFVLARPGFYLNTSSDATLLRTVLDAAEAFDPERHGRPDAAALADDVARQGMEPIFVRGFLDQI